MVIVVVPLLGCFVRSFVMAEVIKLEVNVVVAVVVGIDNVDLEVIAVVGLVVYFVVDVIGKDAVTIGAAVLVDCVAVVPVEFSIAVGVAV